MRSDNLEQQVEEVLQLMREKDGKLDFTTIKMDKYGGDAKAYTALSRRIRTKGLANAGQSNPSIYELTEYGWTFKGFDEERKQEAEKAETTRISNQKLKHDAKVSRWTYHTYWVMFFIALASLIMSILALSRK